MSAPIKNTCPDIDKLQKIIKTQLRDATYYRKNAEDEGFKLFADSIEDALDDISSSLEDLRSSNDTLRNWGKEMEEEAESLQVQLSELQEKYDELLNDSNTAQ